MPPTDAQSQAVGRLAVAFVTTSLLCAAILVAFPEIAWVRGILGSGGFNLGCLGAGIALWGCIRVRHRLCYLATVLSIPNAAIWAWMLYLFIYHENRI